MRIFLSFRFTGEDIADLKAEILPVIDYLSQAGHQVSCSLPKEEEFLKQGYSQQEIFKWALGEIDASDLFLALVRSPEKSEGMLIETGYALARRKPIVLVSREGAPAGRIGDLAGTTISFSEISELEEKLKHISA